MTKDKLNINRLIDEALSFDNERARYIIVGRYGLRSTNKKTLAQLGKEYNLTRERVRQIENSMLGEIRERIKKHEDAIAFLNLLKNYLENVGDIRRGDYIANDIALLLKMDNKGGELYNKLHFIAKAIGWPNIANGNEDWNVAWYNKPEKLKKAKEVVAELNASKDDDFDKFLSAASAKFKLTEAEIINALTLYKKFGVGPYGDLGLDSWLRVNPKTVKDKVYLVLENAKTPLHFREIANGVNRFSDKKRAPATVHNELIRDPRFILVGRGVYTLK